MTENIKQVRVIEPMTRTCFFFWEAEAFFGFFQKHPISHPFSHPFSHPKAPNPTPTGGDKGLGKGLYYV